MPKCTGSFDDNADGNTSSCSARAGCGLEGCPSPVDRAARVEQEMLGEIHLILAGVRKLVDSGAIQNKVDVPATLGWCPWCKRKLGETGDCACL